MNSSKMRGFLCAGCAASMIAAPAFSQIVPPPVHNSRSATGVAYRGLAYSFEEEDLSVAGGLPNGLSLTRSYNSATVPWSSPYGTSQGWTNNFNIYITVSDVPHYPGADYPAHYVEGCNWNVAGGPGSTRFTTPGHEFSGGFNSPASIGCGQPPSSPLLADGQSLEWVGTYPSGYFRFINSDGSVINFQANDVNGRATDWTMPDGTRLDFNYNSSLLRSIFSNHGWAVIFESDQKSCIVNTALTYVTAATTTCPAGAQTATYTFAAGTYNNAGKFLTSATVGGNTRTYVYGSADHVVCIKDPGQSTCRIQNTYGHCQEDTYYAPSGIQPSYRMLDPVTSQQDGSGRTYTYTTDLDLCPWMYQYASDPTNYPDYRPFSGATTSVAETGIAGSNTVTTDPDNQVLTSKDPLNRQTGFSYLDSTSGLLTNVTFPEANQIIYGYDGRANRTSSTAIAKPGSGLASISSSSVFPDTCTNRVTCNKPTSVTDARGNTTDYTYDSTHGGVLTETLPAGANGIRPVKRYSYVQRSAWVANGSGGYTASSYPVWLLNDVRTCRTTATVGNACAGGSADEVVTTYDYGPNSGPNNLLVRGIVVAADGTSRRTCYGYDRDGHKISETKPNANLSACP
jgi:YD repeat-containing protein